MPKVKKNKKRINWLFWSVVVVTVGVACVAVDLLIIFPNLNHNGKGRAKTVAVAAGSGPLKLALALKKADLISSPGRFALWVRITKKMPQIQAGEFEVTDNLTPNQIVRLLNGPGLLKGVRVTVPEGLTLSKIGETLQTAGLASKQAFLAAATDTGLLSDLKIPGRSVEGYLFPDTYFFDKSNTATGVIEIMHRRFKTQWDQLATASGSKIDPNQRHRAVILASIVQAEAKITEEMPVIAGVYLNRLTAALFPSQRLQADPTVSYGCESIVRPRAPSCRNYSGVLTRTQLQDPQNPYNTYLHPGLPPGPICAPGIDAIKAALHPTEGPYLYFVAGRAGRHVFSKTLEEHQRAVAQYRKLSSAGQ